MQPYPPISRPTESVSFNGWTIGSSESCILKSVCPRDADPNQAIADCCELCMYNANLRLPHLPDMVFHKNHLTLQHKDGAKLSFNPMDALKLVSFTKPNLEISCAEAWRSARPESSRGEKFKEFDWTFTSNYEGTLNDKFRIEPTENKINRFKLMQREQIIFFKDIVLYDDELHDHGTSSCTVKIRVMASGFFILLRHFLRLDNVVFRTHETRYHYEIENDYILKEHTVREAYVKNVNIPIALHRDPNELEQYLSVVKREASKLFFKNSNEQV